MFLQMMPFLCGAYYGDVWRLVYAGKRSYPNSVSMGYWTT